jgi:hypothetical protein
MSIPADARVRIAEVWDTPSPLVLVCSKRNDAIWHNSNEESTRVAIDCSLVSTVRVHGERTCRTVRVRLESERKVNCSVGALTEDFLQRRSPAQRSRRVTIPSP